MIDQKIKILIVEDEELLQKAVKKKLELENFDPIQARTIGEGMRALEVEVGVAAIWLDHYLLGRETGLDFVIQLKQKAKFANLPVFVVSNTAGLDTVRAYQKLGIAEYYVKSDHRLEEIVRDVKKFIR